MQKISTLGWRVAEYVFMFFFVLILPIWFPLLVVYVILDPPYYIALWRRKRKRS